MNRVVSCVMRESPCCASWFIREKRIGSGIDWMEGEGRDSDGGLGLGASPVA